VILGFGFGLLIAALVIWENRFFFAHQFDIGDVTANEWVLDGVDEDGDRLVVTTTFGGVASSCVRFDGWEVDERDDAVEVTALLWVRRFVASCTDEAIQEELMIELDAPLGNRALLGCGQADCLPTVTGDPGADAGEIVVAGDFLAVQRLGSNQAVLTTDGSRADREPNPDQRSFREGRALFGSVAVFNSDRGLVALDLGTDEVLWRTSGSHEAVEEDVVYVCRGPNEDRVVSINARTGEERWTAQIPCSGIVPQGDLVTLVTFDPEVDGGHLLAQIDSGTGEVLSIVPLDDGTEDQVTGLDGAVGVAGLTVTGGEYANLIIFDSLGREVFRQQDGIAQPLASVDGVVFFGGHDSFVAYDPERRRELWQLDSDAFTNVAIDDGGIWQLTTSHVSRLDPLDGNTLWTVEVGVTSSFDVREHDGVAFVVTSLEVFAIDNESGRIIWSEAVER